MRQPIEIFAAEEGAGFEAVKFATPGLDVTRVKLGRRLVRVGEYSRMRAWLVDVSGCAWVCTREFALRHLERTGLQQPIPRGIPIFLGHE